MYKTTTVVLATTLVMACSNQPKPKTATEHTTQTQALELEDDLRLDINRDYKHPLRGVEPVNGKVPGVTTHNSPSGKRYTITQAAAELGPEQFLETSEISELEWIQKSPEEIEETFGPIDTSTLHPPSRIGPKLGEVIEDLEEHDAMGVSIWFRDPMNPAERMLVHRLEELIGLGQITTHGEYHEMRRTLLTQRTNTLRATQDPLIASIVNTLGVEDESALYARRCEHSPCLSMLIRKDQLQTLMSIQDIELVDLHSLPTPEANTVKQAGDFDSYSGDWMTGGVQLNQFYKGGYNGGYVDENIGQHIRVGILETGEFDLRHYANYKKSSSDHYNRALIAYGCEPVVQSLSGTTFFFEDCDWRHLNPDETTPHTTDTSYLRINALHATNMAGIIIGNLLDDQDPNFGAYDQQLMRSGYGRDTGAYYGWYNMDKFWEINGVENPKTMTKKQSLNTSRKLIDSPMSKTIERLTVAGPSLINISQGDILADKNCHGFDPLSRRVNTIYESGVLPVKSSGNTTLNGDSAFTRTTCNVTSPGSANGALVVTAHDDQDDQWFNGSIYERSSIGGEVINGSVAQGKGRSIIDLAVQTNAMRIAKYNRDYMDQSDTLGNSPLKGTSNSAALLSASLSLYVDFFKSRFSNLIDDPGILTSNALVMGDRMNGQLGLGINQPAPWSTMDIGYDYIWGAGRFKARMWNHAGMDAPAEWRTGRVCVGNREVVKVPINGLIGKMPSEAKTLKVVINWYDADHQYKLRRDQYGMQIVRNTPGLTEQERTIALTSTTPLEDKGRLVVDDVGQQYANEQLALWITGINVGGRETICGSDGNAVYYTIYYEAEDRNDLNGPDQSIETTPSF